jgi:hypothetical protein
MSRHCTKYTPRVFEQGTSRFTDKIVKRLDEQGRNRSKVQLERAAPSSRALRNYKEGCGREEEREILRIAI